ncbi:MAG: hypothetical protein P8Y10_10900 [Gemmatimonadales bacterium]|jgi:hypothetical protein
MTLDLPRQRRPVRPRRAALACLPALALALACAEEVEPTLETPPDDSTQAERVAISPAEYSTEMAFVSFAPRPFRLFARFVNRTSEEYLERSYGGWLESGGPWQPLAPVHDRLPVPRAAWRVLPGGPWRVMAAEGGEIAGLVYRDTSSAFRLTPGELVTEWTGETGQREALLIAQVQQGDSLQNGLLVLRRSARLLSAAGSEGVAPPAGSDSLPDSRVVGLRTQLFLLVDSLNNGLLVARDADDPDSTAMAWTWVGSIGNEWTDVRVQPPEDVSRALARWLVELPEAGVTARFRVEPLPEDSTAGGIQNGRMPHPYAVQGRLEILGDERPASGLGVESRS